MKLVIEFFDLHFMAIIEQKKAARIERFFCNIRRMRIRAKFNEYIFKMRGFSMSMEKLPRGIALFILSYLPKKDILTTVSCLGIRYRSLANDPYLWRQICFFASKDQVNPFQGHYFSSLVMRSSQLKVLSLRYCQHVNEDTMTIIADHANPFYLKELYLDGCEQINDAALSQLTKDRSGGLHQIPDLHKYRISELVVQQ